MRRKNRFKLLSLIFISGSVSFLFIIAATLIYAQNPMTNTVQAGPTKAKEVLVIFEVDLKGLTPKPIQEGVLTDALTAEFAEAGNYNLVDRDTLYYYFKQIQEKTKKPCTGPECLADLAANLDADLFVKAEVSKAGKECRFSVKLYKRKPQTVLYFVDQTKIESCSCQAAGLEKAAKNLGRKLTGREDGVSGIAEDLAYLESLIKRKPNGQEDRVSGKLEEGREFNPPGTKGGPMVFVPAGEFMMGCNEKVDKECDDSAKPYHRVYLDAYYINKFEVTVSEYRKCVNAGKCNAPVSKSDNKYCNWGYLDRGNHPVTCVDWSQAIAYCEWAGKRLPTEAEWEKAARGTDERVYPYGNQFDCGKSCNSVSPCSHNSTCPVGSYAQDKSPYGVMDMAGNVWEWVSDWYVGDYYSNSPSNNPEGPSSGSHRVLRGGSRAPLNPEGLRASSRGGGNPAVRTLLNGFRCASNAK